MTDGRNIDPELGILAGEGAQMRPELSGRAPVISATPDTYYNQPVIKKSPWKLDIPVYYFVGGATGGLMSLGAAATLLNRNHLSGLITRSRWLANGGAALSAVLLIHDLGRPSRFLNMLRVFRPTSPMSMGTWILVSFSGVTAVSALAQSLRVVGDTAAVVGGILGLALSGYTGVLVSNTVVPIWHQPHRIMPVLFLASGSASAASVIDFFEGNPQERKATKIYGLAGKAVELAAAASLEKEVFRVPEVGKPLRQGVAGALWQAGKMLTAASLVLALVPQTSAKLRRFTASLGIAGSLCIRFGIHYAGQRSAENPRATFHQQRHLFFN